MLDYRTHTFLEVYRQRSFTQAARSLMITQPAVSQHIKQLESHYGCPLFVKTGRGIEPTPAATVLYQRLLTMENDDARLVAEVGRLTAAPTKARRGASQAGMHADHRRLHGPAARGSPSRSAPQQPRHATGRQHTRPCGRPRSGRYRLRARGGSFDRERFDYEVLSHEPYIAVAGGADAEEIVTRGTGAETEAADPTGTEQDASRTGLHARVARPSSIRDLLGERLILREAGSGTREILENTWRRAISP